MGFEADIPVSTCKKIVMALLLLEDASLMLAAEFLAIYLRFGSLWPSAVSTGQFGELFLPQLVFVLLPAWLIIFALHRLYDFDSLFWGSGELGRVVNAITLGFVATILAGYAMKMEHISRAWMLLAWALAVTFVSGGRLLFRGFLGWLHKKGILTSRTLLVGDNEEAAALLRRVVNTRGSELTAVGYVGETSGALRDSGISYVGPVSRIRQVVESRRIDTLLVASTAFTHREIADLLNKIRGLQVDVHISSGLFEILAPRVFVKEIAGIPMTTVKSISLTRGKLLVKRTSDLMGSVTSITLLSPFLLGVAALIKLTSPGPVLYRQERIGRHGKPFTMYKFRSMAVGCDDSEHKERVAAQIALGDSDEAQEAPDTYKTQTDTRITWVGRWIRKFSIDEFPQLLNVVTGEMSLVGPRPPLKYEVDMYEDWMMGRLEVTPGMTGLWQVSGRANLPYNEMIKLDLYYIQNWSLRFDLSILVRTIPVVLFPRGAY